MVGKETPALPHFARAFPQVSEDHLSGIFRWDRQTNTVRRFAKLTQVVECPSGDGLTLELQNLTTGDSGVYRCSLWAPIGHRNREGDIQLGVTGTAIFGVPGPSSVRSATRPTCITSHHLTPFNRSYPTTYTADILNATHLHSIL